MRLHANICLTLIHKIMKKSYFLLMFMLLPHLCNWADTKIEINGIKYSLFDNFGHGTAHVLSNEGKYTGDISIPSTVRYNEKDYAVEQIYNSAFANCTGLTSISMPSIKKINGNAFDNCSGLTTVEFSPNCTSIEPSAFRNCTNLISVKIPTSNLTILTCAFQGCKKLSDVILGNADDTKGISIARLAFESCENLKSVTFKNPTHLGERAFGACSQLQSVTYLKSEYMRTIGDGAFQGCYSLTDVTYDAFTSNSLTAQSETHLSKIALRLRISMF